jgi:autotransporter strand-loop-strand O-heptosyltransferase
MKVKAHTCFIGETGYANHARNFFTALNRLTEVKVRNFTVGKTWDKLENAHDNEWYLTQEHKDMLVQQVLFDHGERADYPIYAYDKDYQPDINITLETVNHHLFHDNHNGYNIGYNVWETTRYPDNFFELIKKYDEFWVPTQWQATCLSDQGYPKDKIKIIPEAVDGNVFKPISQKRPGKFRFVVCGRWDYRKATEEIIRNFLKEFEQDDVELILNVDNPHAKDGLTTEQRLEKLGLNHPKIKIVHFLSRDEYVDLLQNAHVFISCARSEGWNLPLIEAMACGIPSLYSDWGGQLEFASGRGIPVDCNGCKPAANPDNGTFEGDFPGVYCEPDWEDFRSALRQVYWNIDEFDRAAKKHSVEIRTQFTWENAAKIAYKELKKIEPNKVDRELELVRREIITDNIYGKFFEVEKDDLVMDIGAHVGTFSEQALNAGAKLVVALEPDKINYEKLKGLQTKHPISKLVIMNKACAGTPFVEFVSDGINSRVEAGGKHVPACNFKMITDYSGIGGRSHIDFLKMDCEGGEFHVFDDYERLKKKIKKMVTEVHLVNEDARIDFLLFIKKLKKDGIKYVITSVDGVDITNTIFNKLDYYQQVLFYTRFDGKSLNPTKVEYSYTDGATVEIKGGEDVEHDVKFFTPDLDLIYGTKLRPNHWGKLNAKYYVDLLIEVDGDFIDTLLKDKTVWIDFDTASLGDTLAWMPYAEEFRKKHECKVITTSKYTDLFDYPEIDMRTHEANVECDAKFKLGYYFDDRDMAPRDPRTIGLQETACDILGLEYKEIKPKLIDVDIHTDPEAEKLPVAIATQSTSQCKYWTKEGWEAVVDYLKEDGRSVFCIDQHHTFGGKGVINTIPSNVLDMTGDVDLKTRMSQIKGCGFFIGLGSGLSWLAWACDVPVILISGFSEPFAEFDTPYRVINKNVCHGCWNDPELKFDKNDWNWCPRNKNFECSTSITPEMVIDQIKNFTNK